MEAKFNEIHAGFLPSSAAWIARREQLPTSIRAVARFYSRTGNLDIKSLKLRRQVENTVDNFLQDVYEIIEKELEDHYNKNNIKFNYKTKLTLPVELTLGYLYERESNTHTDSYEDARGIARLVTEALLDGDMRDAINDDEYKDFKSNIGVNDAERAEVAKIAQNKLETHVSNHFDQFPEGVREAYATAKEESENHQEEDSHYRELLRDAQAGSTKAIEEIKSEYKYAKFSKNPEILSVEEQGWPYCYTQYKRVGVIYSGMTEMFRAAGINIESEFKRAIVLSIIGAQIWLDDIDDFDSDIEESQLTPVTAEYTIQDTEMRAYKNIVDISKKYLDKAARSATRSGSDITGIATEYIYLSGQTNQLPN